MEKMINDDTLITVNDLRNAADRLFPAVFYSNEYAARQAISEIEVLIVRLRTHYPKDAE